MAPIELLIILAERRCRKCGSFPSGFTRESYSQFVEFHCKCGHHWTEKAKALDKTLKERRYEIKGAQIGRLVDRKQREYGDSWGAAANILQVLFPNGIKPEQYHVVLGIARVIDKLKRIANGNKGEEDAWLDIAGYGLLGSMDGERG